MKNTMIAIALVLASLLSVPVKAQTRVTVGVEGARNFDNSSIGVAVGVEVPFLKRYELDLRDAFSPLESHVSLGGGRANRVSVGGVVWLSNTVGINAKIEDSTYNVTKATKDSDYFFGGLSYRTSLGGLPVRFSSDYIRQFNNGITASGLESSHLQGFDLGYTMRFGCLGAICIRSNEDFVFGRVLTQSNPVCDGTYGVTGGPNGGPCPRQAAFGGGVTASVTVEFPRHRGHEYDVF